MDHASPHQFVGFGIRITVPDIKKLLSMIVAWLRAGYPADAPGNGYSPLLALCGRHRLSATERAVIVEELARRPGPVQEIDIRLAVLAHTDTLPEDTDIRRIAHDLGRRL